MALNVLKLSRPHIVQLVLVASLVLGLTVSASAASAW